MQQPFRSWFRMSGKGFPLDIRMLEDCPGPLTGLRENAYLMAGEQAGYSPSLLFQGSHESGTHHHINSLQFKGNRAGWLAMDIAVYDQARRRLFDDPAKSPV